MSGLLFGYYKEYENGKKLDLEFSKNYSHQIITSYLESIRTFKDSLIYSKEFTDFVITYNDFGSFTENIIYGKILDLYQGRIDLLNLEIKDENNVTIFKFVPKTLSDNTHHLSFSYPIMLDEQGLNSKSAIKRGSLYLNIGTSILEKTLPENTTIQGIKNNVPQIKISEKISFFRKHLPIILFLVGILIASTIIIGIKLLNSNIVRPIVDIVKSLREKSNLAHSKISPSENEINLLKNAISNYVKHIEDSKEALIKKENDAVMIKVANQVAHDIRSPLSALDSILNYTTDLPSEEATIVRLAVARINDIANNLLDVGRETETFQPRIEMLSPVIESIISEKRTQYKHLNNLVIEFTPSASKQGHFVNVVKHDLKNILSNIINNSVESFVDSSHTNSVIIDCSITNKLCQISVKDNGAGIPDSVLEKIFKEKYSYGKPNGNGIGLYSAKEMLAKYNGHIEIESEVNKGTIVKILLPHSITPLWFCKELIVSKKKICIIDDDKSIHQLWFTKFKALRLNLQISYLTTFPTQVDEDTLYLVDYEFTNQDFNGLDKIISLKMKDSYLVTSHFENTQIQMKAMKHGIEIISKNLISSLPIALS